MRLLFGWLSSPWVGTVLAILSLAAAVYFYRKSKSVARLSYQFAEITVVGGAEAAFPAELEILFGGIHVPRVTATRVTIWNSGNTTIKGDQIVAADRLRFEVSPESMILRAAVGKVTRAANAVQTGIQDNAVLLDFDYLDPNDGAALGIYHSAGRREIRCTGTLRGLSGGPVNAGTTTHEMDRRLSRLLPRRVRYRSIMWVGLGVGIFLLIGGLYTHSTLSSGSKPKEIDPSLLIVSTGALYVLMTLFVLWTTRRKHPKALDRDS